VGKERANYPSGGGEIRGELKGGVKRRIHLISSEVEEAFLWEF